MPDIRFSATTDQTTMFNLIHPNDFNLDGFDSIAKHLLEAEGDCFLPIDDKLIPTGKIRALAGAAFDFKAEKAPEPVCSAQTLDHSFCLSENTAKSGSVARLKGLKSEESLEIRTTGPGLQVCN